MRRKRGKSHLLRGDSRVDGPEGRLELTKIFYPSELKGEGGRRNWLFAAIHLKENEALLSTDRP